MIKKKEYRVNAAPRKLIKYKYNAIKCLQSALFSKFKEVSVVKLSAIWKQHFTASFIEKKHKQTRDCLLDIM